MDETIDRGIDLMRIHKEGDTWPVVSPFGGINTANSIAAIQHLVFEQKKYTMEELVHALDAFALTPHGVALDIGASTGGFTEVLLARGAERVFAVDVGHSQLHRRVKADPRVVSLEGINARSIPAGLIPPVDWIVADVSFISLEKALPGPLALARPGRVVGLVGIAVIDQLAHQHRRCAIVEILPHGAGPAEAVVGKQHGRTIGLAAFDEISSRIEVIGFAGFCGHLHAIAHVTCFNLCGVFTKQIEGAIGDNHGIGREGWRGYRAYNPCGMFGVVQNLVHIV